MLFQFLAVKPRRHTSHHVCIVIWTMEINNIIGFIMGHRHFQSVPHAGLVGKENHIILSGSSSICAFTCPISSSSRASSSFLPTDRLILPSSCSSLSEALVLPSGKEFTDTFSLAQSFPLPPKSASLKCQSASQYSSKRATSFVPAPSVSFLLCGH